MDATPQNEKIQARAYELYLERGREDGHDLEDWLSAEKELAQRRKEVQAIFEQDAAPAKLGYAATASTRRSNRGARRS